MLFCVLFISIIEHTEDDIYVPSLSANHPKIFLILSTLGYQKPAQGKQAGKIRKFKLQIQKSRVTIHSTIQI